MQYNINEPTGYFHTPGGLKIRLRPEILFGQIAGDDMIYALKETDCMFLMPTALLQWITLFAVIFQYSIPIFCTAAVSLYALGCICRLLRYDLPLNKMLLSFPFTYRYLRWPLYVALTVLVFVLDSKYLIIPYLSLRVALYLLTLLSNHFILKYTKKKYGVPFNDTEICAFRVFHKLTGSTLDFSNYIKTYVQFAEEENAVEGGDEK